MPDTYVEPFVAYRSWNWNAEGITSLNGSLWTPKEAFEAKCPHVDDLRSMQAAAPNTPAMKAAKAFWDKQTHLVPDPDCTCGMYAGINMQHLIDINYIQRGIHGEVCPVGAALPPHARMACAVRVSEILRRPDEHDSVPY